MENGTFVYKLHNNHGYMSNCQPRAMALLQDLLGLLLAFILYNRQVSLEGLRDSFISNIFKLLNHEQRGFR